MKTTDNLNMDGLEVNSEIMKQFKNFKQGSILESSLFQSKYVISREMQQSSNFDVKEISKREIAQKFSLEILQKYKDSFEETETPYGTEMSLSMLVMVPSELKHIVEYCVRTMPQSAIEEIRK